jgi:hypothetical protein
VAADRDLLNCGVLNAGYVQELGVCDDCKLYCSQHVKYLLPHVVKFLSVMRTIILTFCTLYILLVL